MPIVGLQKTELTKRGSVVVPNPISCSGCVSFETSRRQAVYPDIGVSWFYSAAPLKCWDSTLNKQRPLPSVSLIHIYSTLNDLCRWKSVVK